MRFLNSLYLVSFVLCVSVLVQLNKNLVLISIPVSIYQTRIRATSSQRQFMMMTRSMEVRVEVFERRFVIFEGHLFKWAQQIN